MHAGMGCGHSLPGVATVWPLFAERYQPLCWKMGRGEVGGNWNAEQVLQHHPIMDSMGSVICPMVG